MDALAVCSYPCGKVEASSTLSSPSPSMSSLTVSVKKNNQTAIRDLTTRLNLCTHKVLWSALHLSSNCNVELIPSTEHEMNAWNGIGQKSVRRCPSKIKASRILDPRRMAAKKNIYIYFQHYLNASSAADSFPSTEAQHPCGRRRSRLLWLCAS